VLALAPWFARARGSDPLVDPRTRVFVDDGRHHLITHDVSYDVITAEPPPPNHAGVVNLYSREFYALAKRRLAPGGVITQWLPVFQLSDSDVRSMIAAFVAEFPHTALLYGHDKQFVLIGSAEPLAIDPALAARHAQAPRLFEDLSASGIGAAADVLGSVLQTDAELRKLAHGVAPLSDDRPVIQYPWEALGAYPDYAALFGTNAARSSELLARGVAAADVAAVQNAQRVIDAIVGVLDRVGTMSDARAQAVLDARLRTAFATAPGHDAARLLIGIGDERVRLAGQALARPDADRLLTAPAQQAHGAGELQRRRALEDAALTQARCRLAFGDCIAADRWLARVDPSQVDGAFRALLDTRCATGAP
jgi:hypothetical protein